MDVAEERRLVGGHRLDDGAVQLAKPLGAQARDQVAQRGQALAAYDRRQARVDQVCLARLEDDRGALVDQLPDEIEVRVAALHLRLQRRHRASQAIAFPRPAHTLRTISAEMLCSGRTASARPARATKPGIPQTTLLCSSCAR